MGRRGILVWGSIPTCWDHDTSWRRTRNWLSHPGTPNFFMVSIIERLSTLLIYPHPKKKVFSCVDSIFCCFQCHWFTSWLLLYLFFLFDLGLCYPSFSTLLRWKLRLLILDFFSSNTCFLTFTFLIKHCYCYISQILMKSL